MEGEDMVVLVDFARRDLARHDFAKNAVVTHGVKLQTADGSGMG